MSDREWRLNAKESLDQDASLMDDNDFLSAVDINLSPSPVQTLDDRLIELSTGRSPNLPKTPTTKKAKRIRFFRNGDKFYTGVVMAVTPERYRSFDSLATDLTRALISSVTLPNGVRAIYAMDGSRVKTVDDLEDGKCYVVSGQGENFKKVEYSSSRVKRGGSLSGLLQSPAATGRQSSGIPLCVKARIVTIIRHGTKPRKVVRLLLNKRNAPSLERAMEAITEAVKLDTGAVRKVFTLSGLQVTSLEQFFENEEIFVAYGPEKSSQEDFELDFEESKCVQSFKRSSCVSRTVGPAPRMPRKSGKKVRTAPQVRTPSPSPIVLPQPLRLQYTIGHVIGDGNFAVVRHCIHKSTGAEYAMKIIDKYKCEGKGTMLASEVAILRQVCHPNIISLITEQETSDQLYLVMELVKGGDLFDAIAAATKFTEAEAAVMIGHLTSALAYLHSHHIVHRDVKPENLLVEMDGSRVRCLKLGDFGLAQVVREPLYTVCGTPTYVAPEILGECGYGLKIDVWAAGVILYILLCGFPPFVSPENDQEELFERILSSRYEFTAPYWDAISESAKQLISNMLQAQPELRFSAEDVLDHPWLTEASKPHQQQHQIPTRRSNTGISSVSR
ncbi:serine/threonine-protein kinase GD17699 isoform X2 [Prorops nasuta]|uniref:serine/threonine-protein kinase GD17699 isoform X2 n=1 Tax=Prorops nasuta TaxID=863751 RepID=UPI0034CD4B11